MICESYIKLKEVKSEHCFDYIIKHYSKSFFYVIILKKQVITKNKRLSNQDKKADTAVMVMLF